MPEGENKTGCPKEHLTDMSSQLQLRLELDHISGLSGYTYKAGYSVSVGYLARYPVSGYSAIYSVPTVCLARYPVSVGYSARYPVSVGYSALYLVSVGYSARYLVSVEYSARYLVSVGYSARSDIRYPAEYQIQYPTSRLGIRSIPN